MEKGKIIAIRGVVVDVVFEKNVPNIYNAIETEKENSAGTTVIIEVLQQLEDGVVRGIAMGSTDGLKRGDIVKDTGKPISVPVGPNVLGRITNILGKAIDNKPEIETKEYWPIHRHAPDFKKLSNKAEVLETGIKVIDLVAPILKGGKQESKLLILLLQF